MQGLFLENNDCSNDDDADGEGEDNVDMSIDEKPDNSCLYNHCAATRPAVSFEPHSVLGNLSYHDGQITALFLVPEANALQALSA